MPVSNSAAAAMEKAEMEAYKRAVEENARLKAKMREGSSGKRSSSTKGKGNKSHHIVIAGEKLSRSEVRELAEKGLKQENRRENELERAGESRKLVNQFKDMAITVGLTSGTIGWFKKHTGVFDKIPEIASHPAAKDGLIAAVLFYLAEKETNYKWKAKLMGMALGAVAVAAHTFGQSFEGANDIAKKIDEKLGTKSPLIAAAP